MVGFHTLLIICSLLVSQAFSYQRPNLGHAPQAPPGSAVGGAFGGPVQQGQVMWVTAKVPVVASANPTDTPTTEEPTTEAPTTVLPTTEEPTTEKPTTQTPTTEAPTTENPSTEKPTTEAPTTEAPTTVLPTTEEPTTGAPTAGAPTTEEPTTAKQVTTQDPTTAADTTENPTTMQTAMKANPTTPNVGINQKPAVVNPSSISSTTLSPMWNSAGGKWHFNKLPDGTLIDDLTDNDKIYNGSSDYSKVIASNKNIYVLHAAQNRGAAPIFNPLTIGRVLGYLYELREFEDAGPPGGQYTIELFGGRIPTKFRRAAKGGKRRRAALIFTKKDI